ncbi:tyrosine-protein phosphatase non-receptor type substrate 1-like isoform X3 [Corvus hawaiiensis]|uniref:tyrosine-protein phosphatase non-receptor type substrate 1-like isoform X3 n=1 Tax=Corvus hawaiiensis TaxID=134902 RepID=UPI0020190B84|nr:tyrosine-protein phosphatase non-receptor type substrate 1-like isoform X3 [Corvus hawaiiensis]
MEPHPRDPGRTAWALPCLLLLALPGAELDQNFKLQQPQDKVLVTAGETLTLNCTISRVAELGPVRWLKGLGSGNKTIYGQTGDSLPRVTRAVVGSNTDFSIHIRNVEPEDMGTYYCVKFATTVTGVEGVLQHGNGTEVSVQAKPSPPLVSGPEQRAMPRQSVPFTCTTGGFLPKEIGVKWFKNKDPMTAQPPQVTEEPVKSYRVSSTVMVTLQEDDVRSQLICEVQHSTLPAPLRGTYQLSRTLRVPPSVEVRAEPSPVEVNKTVTFTCHIKEFYPENMSVFWLENGIEIKEENISRPSELPRGLFKLRRQVEVQATEEKNGSTITCVVVHDAQAPVNYSAVLWISNPAQGGLSKGSQMDTDDMLIYIVVGVVCIVLVLLVVAILYLIRTKQIKAGKSSPSARLHEPEKSSEAMTQESDPNNLTYADLNFDKERKTIRRMVEMSQQSEYACIQTNQAPNGDDNLTYADLDMVHLSKAPKRSAPRPEEAGSEYASVQITRK